MSESFSVLHPGALAGEAVRRHVLITGAAGRIGSFFASQAHEQYRLRLLIHPSDDAAEIESYGEVVVGDIGDLELLKSALQGIDTLVHLAADPSPDATWSSLLPLNIVGTYNAFVAAKAAGCRRVVYASSIHAVSGYPTGVQVRTNDPVNPADLYGVTKCFGEALGRYMAEQEGLSVIAIRIGGFQPPEEVRGEQGLQVINSWVSRRDLAQLIRRSIDVENLKFAIFHGLSNNRFKQLDISDARALLGYEPQDDIMREQPELMRLKLGHE